MQLPERLSLGRLCSLKRSLRCRLVSPIYILEAALNHVDGIKSITSNVKFDFVICGDKGWWC